ncbi:NUDIX hydrolase [Thermodesulfatator indicus DSM 15286]|uniref:8-oxo-dGTP diphosphatase n=1 Tax=Thermodesulfatator indicus (strain DSM 15286 / JCM 11887 / CIR29812) TaxID=667014 RepID=F8AC86_THEID|nr:(deoxy)nucleoside triphosphate pyrophosphohydrolase [Thermodesulfatator indicus]AEH45721.1 NUDIX hydrolase [Thermodesulfatator indicus DSM 15286]
MRFPVVAALLLKDGKVLLTQRPPGKIRAGFWEFPGGKLEKGETLEKALEREILEELGLKVAVGQKLAEVDFNYPEAAITLHCFRCEILSGTPQALEGQKIGLFLPSDIENLSLAPADKLLWQEIKKTLESGSQQ